jgi:hypothetical protein
VDGIVSTRTVRVNNLYTLHHYIVVSHLLGSGQESPCKARFKVPVGEMWWNQEEVSEVTTSEY